MSDLCHYCLEEMVACYSGDNQEYFRERLKKAPKTKADPCECTLPLKMRVTKAGHCKCQCTCPRRRTIKILYNQKLEPVRII